MAGKGLVIDAQSSGLASSVLGHLSTSPRKIASWDKDGIVGKHVDATLDNLASDLDQARQRIKENIPKMLRFLIGTFEDSQAIAVVEEPRHYGLNYFVADSGDYERLEEKMCARTSSRGDLYNLNYEILRMSELKLMDIQRGQK